MQRPENDIPTPEAVGDLAARLGRELDESCSKGLAAYLAELVKWNKRLNLTGAGDWRRALSDLVADSWHLADFLSGLTLPDNPLSLDIGAGAGLPGVPLRLFWTNGDYVMVEPRQKRAAFLNVAVAVTGIQRTKVVRARAEGLAPELKNAQLVLGRAVMPWRDFLDLASGLLASGGWCVVFANAQEPQAPLPNGFIPGPRYSYAAQGKTRYFWSFSKL